MNWKTHENPEYGKHVYANTGKRCVGILDVFHKNVYVGDVWISPDIDKQESPIVKIYFQKNMFTFDEALQKLEKIFEVIA